MLLRERLYGILLGLKGISKAYGDFGADNIDALLKLLDDNKFKMAVIGEFSVGKSTFLNAMMGKRVLYSSNNEATGSVTCIQNSDRREACIYKENEITILELENNEDFNTLTEYINIQNEDRASRVQILYPLAELGGDIVLIDTPGLAGINEQQITITRDILREVNAVIMLISCKGLEESELKLLTGSDNRLGTIDNDNVLVVINQIGRIYDRESNIVGNSMRVNKVIDEVEVALRKNGLMYRVFALDSRDYLWSKDDELYSLISNGSDEEEILSQKEYEIRSRFKEFKEFLNSFLYNMDISRKFEEDMTKKLRKLLQEFIRMIREEMKEGSLKSKRHIEELDKHKKLLLQNRKAITNQLVRYQRDCLYTILDSIKGDIDLLKIDTKAVIAKYIDDLYVSDEDFHEDNHKKLNDKINYIIYNDGLRFANSINRQYKIIVSNLLNKKFIESITKFTKDEIKFSFSIDIRPVIIQKQAANLEVEWNSVIEEKLGEIKDIERHIEELNVQKSEIDDINAEWVIKKLHNKKMFLNKEYTNKMNSLGRRPDGKSAFKEVEEMDGWLMFRRKVKKRIRDGMDYSEAIEWEKRKEEIVNEYLNEDEAINDEIEKYKRLIMARESIIQEINMTNEEKESIQSSIEDIKRDMERRKHKDLLAYVRRRRNEIFKMCSVYINKAYQEIMGQIENGTYEMMNSLKSDIQKGMDEFINSYSGELDSEIDKAAKDTGGEEDRVRHIEQLEQYLEITV